jgi:preprotein translocase subunit SecG
VSDGGKSTLSGAKGFAIVLGGMLGIMVVLWLLGALVAP